LRGVAGDSVCEKAPGTSHDTHTHTLPSQVLAIPQDTHTRTHTHTHTHTHYPHRSCLHRLTHTHAHTHTHTLPSQVSSILQHTHIHTHTHTHFANGSFSRNSFHSVFPHLVKGGLYTAFSDSDTGDRYSRFDLSEED